MAYNPALDGLRAVAVLAVIAFHCRVPGFDGGFVGVDIFFVLSGFLITRLLRAEISATGRLDLLRFYKRRLLRLAPPLMAFLLIFLATASLIGTDRPKVEYWRDATIAALYLSDYGKAWWDLPSWLGHSWSLSVEEHFYLLWPAALLALSRLPARAAILVLSSAYLGLTAWRITTMISLGWSDAYFRFDTRLSGLVLGALLASSIHLLRLDRRWIDTLASIAIATIGICVAWAKWGSLLYVAFFVPTVELMAATLIVAAMTEGSTIAGRLSRRPLVMTGLGSYALYLWHVPLAVLLRTRFDWPLSLLGVLALSGIAAFLSWVSIERPLKELRRRQQSLGPEPV